MRKCDIFRHLKKIQIPKNNNIKNEMNVNNIDKLQSDANNVKKPNNLS